MLTRQLYQVGPASPTGFGLVSVNWQEIAAWAALMHESLTTFDAECLMLMSRAYAGEYNATSGKEPTTPPHESDRDTPGPPQEGRRCAAQGLRHLWTKGVGRGRNHWCRRHDGQRIGRRARDVRRRRLRGADVGRSRRDRRRIDEFGIETPSPNTTGLTTRRRARSTATRTTPCCRAGRSCGPAIPGRTRWPPGPGTRRSCHFRIMLADGTIFYFAGLMERVKHSGIRVGEFLMIDFHGGDRSPRAD